MLRSRSGKAAARGHGDGARVASIGLGARSGCTSVKNTTVSAAMKTASISSACRASSRVSNDESRTTLTLAAGVGPFNRREGA